MISYNAIKCKHCGSFLGSEQDREANSGFDLRVSNVLSFKYEISGEIGAGGMSKVYKALHKSLNRLVALKVIHPHLIHDREFVQRFRREAQAGALLHHPNIVMVFDEGEISDVIYIAMEYLDGVDLFNIIKNKGRLPLEDTVLIISSIANALDYVHKKNLVHRDVKSSNIIITKDNRPVLTDFGITHTLGSSEITQPGTIIGTPEFMSPEQANGQPLDGRSDLFSLGIVFYHCLTGKVPFKGDTPMATIYKISFETPTSIYSYCSDLPESVSTILNKCLAKSPADRFQTGKELTEALKKSIPGMMGPTLDKDSGGSRTDKDFLQKEDLNKYSIEDLIKKAEEFLDQQRYDTSLAIFLKVSERDPDDRYNIKKEIEYLQGLIQTIQKAREAKIQSEKEYQSLIKNGEEFLKNNLYREALDHFKKASSLKTFEKLPKERIKEIEIIIAKIKKDEEEQQALTVAYNETIASANLYLESGDYDRARVSFEIASRLKPDEESPKNKLLEIEKIISNLKQEENRKKKIEEEYNRTLFKADELYNIGNYSKAKEFYLKALELVEDSDRARSQIKNLDQVLQQSSLEKSEKERVNAEYNSLLRDGDNLFKEKKFVEALQEFQKASHLKPDEPYPKQIIESIEQTLEIFKSFDEEKKELSTAYKEAVDAADNLYNSDNLEGAKKAYELALFIKPGETYPKERIRQIEEKQKILSLKTASEDKIDSLYQELISDGFRNFKANNYLDAIEAYKKALTLKPDDRLLKDRIDSIISLWEKEKRLEFERLANEDTYKKIIIKADGLFRDFKLEEAKSAYELALGLEVENDYPTAQIGKINHILADLKKKEDDKLLNEENYRRYISLALNAFNKNNYDDSVSWYRKALELKPEDSSILPILETIETIKLSFKRNEDLQLTNEKTLDQILETADQLFKEVKLEEARSAYLIALKIKPDKEYAHQQIEKIDQQLNEQKLIDLKQKELDNSLNELVNKADLLFEEEKFNQALDVYSEAQKKKPDDQYLRNRIRITRSVIDVLEKTGKEKREKDNLLSSLINNGNSLLLQNKFEEAKASFKTASNLSPDNQDVRDKLTIIEQKITNQKKQESEVKELEKSYTDLLERGNDALSSGNLRGAIVYFEQAAQLKPHEKSPKDNIQNLRTILQILEKTDEEKDDKLQAYNKAIETASLLLKKNQLEEAKATFEIAYSIKDTPEVRKRINDVQKRIEDLKSEKAKEQQKEENYQRLISQAYDLYNSNHLEESMECYQKATALKPEENYPKDRIKGIKATLEALKRADQEKKKQNEEYNALIKKAEKHLAAGDLLEARSIYQQSLKFKQDSELPISKIQEIETKILHIDPAHTKVPIKKLIDELIRLGEKYESGGNHLLASKAYQKARELAPNNKLIAKKANELQEKLPETARIDLDKQAQEGDYYSTIVTGLNYHERKNYKKASQFFKKALDLKPSEKIPKEKLQQIRQIVKKRNNRIVIYSIPAFVLLCIAILLALPRESSLKISISNLFEGKSSPSVPPIENIPVSSVGTVSVDTISSLDQKTLEYNVLIQQINLMKIKTFKDRDSLVTLYNRALQLKPDDSSMIARKNLLDENIRLYDQSFIAGERYYKRGELRRAGNNYALALKRFPDMIDLKERIKAVEEKLKNQIPPEEENQPEVAAVKTQAEPVNNETVDFSSSDELIPVKDELSGKYGYKTEYGSDWIIQPKFKMAYPFQGKLAKVTLPLASGGEYQAYITKDTDIRNVNWYKQVNPFKCGRALVLSKEGRYGYLDENGVLVIQCKYYDAKDFENDRAKVQLNQGDRPSMINLNGWKIE
jgi:serine/threonine protein kinase